MHAHRIRLAIGFIVLSLSRLASAGLEIHPVFLKSAPPPPSALVGGGNLQDICLAAVASWERVFRAGGGRWVTTIEFEWGGQPSNLNAQSVKLEESGNPVRITHAVIRFKNTDVDGFFPGWFADPTPLDNSEYQTFSPHVMSLPGGRLNIGRRFSEPIGDAAGRIDLFTIAMHEIGHALGLDTEYKGFIDQFVSGLHFYVTPPRPFAGLEYSTSSPGDHISIPGPYPLMTPTSPVGYRLLISGADVLLIAQLASFPNADLNPYPDLTCLP